MVRILSLCGLPKEGQPLPYNPLTAGAAQPWGLLPGSVASEQIVQGCFWRETHKAEPVA